MADLYVLPPDVEGGIRTAPERQHDGAVLAPFGFANEECLGQIPTELREELREVIGRTTVMAAWVGIQPVAFCYAAAETETWWDVSVDTLAGYRGRGFATAVAAVLIERYHRQGKRATWGAVASNGASRRVAVKLGFEPIDQLMVFERD